MKKRSLAAFLAFLMLSCTLFSACSVHKTPTGTTQAETPTPVLHTEATPEESLIAERESTAAATEEPETVPGLTETAGIEESDAAETDPAPTESIPDASGFTPRQQNLGARTYLPDGEVEMVRFEDMVYTRPDPEAVKAGFSDATALVENGSDADIVLAAFYDAYDLYINFYTMDTIANIRYYSDLTDSYYEAEYEFCEDESPDIEEKWELFLKACAVSAIKTDLEEKYFGEGFLDKYVDYERFTNPDYLALSKQETAILTDYRASQEDLSVTYNGKTGTLDELLEQFGQDEYFDVIDYYYSVQNETVGQYLVELVKVRQKMAAVLGYSSYPEYAFEETYGRDYSWEEGKAYIDAIKEYLVPLQYELNNSYSSADYSTVSEETVRACVAEIAGFMGESILESYNFLNAYNLCDLSVNANKMDTSFATYIYNYETPYILMNANGTTKDVMTFTHEFGHFCDFYVNYGADEDLETAETFSQGLEFLLICNLKDGLSSREIESLKELQLQDAVSVFVQQGLFAAFENEIYSMNPEDVTLEALNAAFLNLTVEFGMNDPDSYYHILDFYFEKLWIDIPHFFESPCYVISYCVSIDTALQIYQLETETPGAGADIYKKLLHRDTDLRIQGLCEYAGLINPFEDGHLADVAQFLRKELRLN